MKGAMTRWLLGLASAALATAADLSGVWTGQIPVGRNNDMLDIAFKFTQSGAVIEGKLYGDFRSARVVEGKVDGDQVAFVVIAEEQAGNQINEVRYKYEGVLKDGELELNRQRESATTAGNRSGAQMRPSTKTAFKLKRLY